MRRDLQIIDVPEVRHEKGQKKLRLLIAGSVYPGMDKTVLKPTKTTIEFDNFDHASTTN